MKVHLLKAFESCMLLACLSLFIISCSDDDPAPSGEYASGVFVINEGNFTEADGSVTFYNRETQEVEQTIFQAVNNVDTLGDVIQSAYTFDGLTYLIANNSNKIEVVNASTFERQFAITNVALPRYMTVSGGKGFLTEWVAFGESGKVSIINLQSGVKEQEIMVGSLPEAIEVVGSKIYVTEAFGSDALYVIDQANNNEIDTIAVGSGSNQIVVDRNNDIWVACGGSNSGEFPNTTPNNDGKLVNIDTETNDIIREIALESNFDAKIAINSQGNTVYYYVSNRVYSHDVEASVRNMSPLFTVSDSFSFYGIGVDPVTSNVFVADAKDFTQDGEIYVYSATGISVSNFSAGRIPGSFLFN